MNEHLKEQLVNNADSHNNDRGDEDDHDDGGGDVSVMNNTDTSPSVPLPRR